MYVVCGHRFQCANGRTSCGPTYVYRHHLPLNSSNSQFQVSLYVFLTYCSWVRVCLCVCVSVCLSVCVSVKSHLTYGASVRPENAVMYSAGNKDQKICGDFPEMTAFESCMP